MERAPFIAQARLAALRGVSVTPAAPAPPERWSIREDLPEYDVVDEENNHLAFTSTVQAEAIAVRDALNAVARGSAHRGALEPRAEFALVREWRANAMYCREG